MPKPSKGASARTLTPQKNDDLLKARDTLSEARFIAEFIQAITLVANGKGINLDSRQTTGLYYVMQDVLDRIQKSEELMANADVSPIEGETA